ncbi:hypothetical protein C8F04DRAFT_1277422 [Mycena alexandri]|uniref:Uncharacterized protein n=1 Tax=Mycena alexandri TaxID=1745969 RepID=A0AAD6WLI9_9AGAR|nr:hypothetical protein C8F04DRAFT_1277422 [Mycena alexandri]
MADLNAITAQPTLHLVPSFSYTPTGPPAPLSLIPIPAAAQVAVSSILQPSAVATRSTPTAAKNASAADFSDSDDEPDAFGPELESYFNGVGDKGKGKGKVPPAPPTPPPPTKISADGSVISDSAVTSGSGSNSQHPFSRAAKFRLGEASVSKTKDSKALHTKCDGLLSAGMMLDDKVYQMGVELGELIDCASFNSYTCARIIKNSAAIPAMQTQIAEVVDAGIHAPPPTAQAVAAYIDVDAIAERVRSREDDAINSLVRSNNKLSDNFRHTMAALQEIDSRLAMLPALLARITELEAALKATTASVHTAHASITLLASGSSGATAPMLAPAPTDLKRAREADANDAARAVRSRTEPVDTAPSFSYTPSVYPTPVAIPAPTPAPIQYQAPPAPFFPAPLVPAPYPQAVPAPQAIYAPPQAVYVHAPAQAVHAPAQVVHAPAQAVHAPPQSHAVPAPPRGQGGGANAGRPPRPSPDPERDVLMGPIIWTMTDGPKPVPMVKGDIVALLKLFLPGAARSMFSTRPSLTNADFTIIQFDSKSVADWIVTNWANTQRGQYANITAVHAFPNTPNA